MAKQIGETRVHTYQVGAAGQITARITIGQGQHGGWAAFLDDKLLGKGSKPRDLKLGASARLKGHRLVVNSVVMDVRRETNRLSVSTLLKGGAKQLRAAHEHVGDAGASANYVTVVIFI
ncbi:MAG TPA: hypothetical protein VNO33_04365 [Kofleriaceae bacterium]|nr:hypothetical protein [Kofleriaceae bacterium]